MATTVFLLGAGASKDAGAPLMAEFLSVAKQLLRASQVNDFKAEYELVFKAMTALQAVHSKSQLAFNNVESLFSALEIAKTIGKFSDWSVEEIDKTIAALRTLIVTTLERTIKFPFNRPEGGLFAPAPYPAFASLLDELRTVAKPIHKIAILTFNYDVCLDIALYHAGEGVHYGLDGTLGDAAYIPLLKLHGSLNWSENAQTKSIQPWKVSDFISRARMPLHSLVTNIIIPIGSELRKAASELGVTGEPVIVAPTFNKGDSHRTLSNVWHAAAKALEDAENIFVIGYSYPPTDNFFEYLYGLGTVGTSLLERFWVINPDSTRTVEERFRGLLGAGAKEAFRMVRKPFNEAIGDIRAEFIV